MSVPSSSNLVLLNHENAAESASVTETDPSDRNYSQRTNMEIENGLISNSVINMSGSRIFGVGNPLIGSDGVNRAYVDRAGNLSCDVNLSGTSESQVDVDGISYGAFLLSINSGQDTWPCGLFALAKSSSMASTSGTGIPSCAYIDSTTGTSVSLQVIWRPNQPISICKTGMQCDGWYRATIFRPANFTTPGYTSNGP